MKNIFKKNQIIITALAIMIAIAGYLSFTNNDKPDTNGTVQTANPDMEELDVISEVDDGADLAQGTTDTTKDTKADGKTNDTTAVDENDETTPVKTQNGTDELGDISDEDILEAANDVKDTGELDLEKGIPGEAVLASTTLDGSFFISNQVEREQLRAKNKADLKGIIESPDVAETLKQDAIAKLIALTEIAEKEKNTEIALEARGFDGALVTISDGTVDVVINAASISDQQLAIIEETIKKKTNISVANMTIVPVIIED